MEDGELLRLPADELNAGVNMLVRVYIAQKRKIMEGDKMAGRHGNKGVISKILPEEDMPFLPDGTPVDIVLNPLGVPSRMNIGQILETHLGYVGRHLNCTFVNPAFEGSTEDEIVEQMGRLGVHFRRRTLENYVNSELGLGMQFKDSKESPEQQLDAMLTAVRERLSTLDPEALEEVSRIVAAPPVLSPVAREIEAGNGHGTAMLPAGDTMASTAHEPSAASGALAVAAPAGELIDQIVARIQHNAWTRAGYDPHTGKTVLRDGLTGETFAMPVTVGVIYMLKLAHLVDDKIHARSTGPYSLVTQQPLGGKAQFGGQRFGEMEVWALEAYGAAYMLQEILTIKSDDVLGRVKTYESIVKGDSMLEPGVPESFKILVNELQSLGLKVTVLDEQDKEIDLRDRDDDIDPHEDPVKAAARRRQKALRLPDEDPGF
jgi:DNA-directed RNA polymerase subunit beta